MKRVISLLLVVLLAFSLTACSQNGGTLPSGGDETTEATSDTVASTEVTSAAEAALSYDEMMSAAQDIDFNKVMTDLSENAARAKETYEGNCYRMAIPVSDIQPDYFYYLDYMGAVMVHLCNTQDLISLNKDCTYDVIGKITEVDGSIVIENAYIVECDELVFEMDGAYFCVAGSIDPAKYNLTPDEYLERNPQLNEENLKDDDKIDLLIFASLNSQDEGKANLYMPAISNGQYVGNSLPLDLIIDGNSYHTIYEMNDTDKRMSKYWEAYKHGNNLDTDYVLRAGSNEKVSIVGLFSVEYGVYKNAVENNLEITLKWGNNYTITFNAADIAKEICTSSISEVLTAKGLLD